MGNLDASSNGARTYDPTSRGWYTRISSGGASAVAADAYQPHRAKTIVEPYIDRFGRGYLITIGCVLAGPDGTTVGVAGADLSVASLQQIVTVIRSRETGEAHFFVRSSGKVIRHSVTEPGTTPHAPVPVTSATASVPVRLLMASGLFACRAGRRLVAA